MPRAPGTTGAAPGRSDRADPRRNYEALLVAAADAFTDVGSSASLEDIARRAGVGIGTLYRHFPTRDDLIAEVLDQSTAAIIARVGGHDQPFGMFAATLTGCFFFAFDDFLLRFADRVDFSLGFAA